MSDLDIEKLRNEVLRKIGRNLLNYQQIERLLKFIVSRGSFAVFRKDTQEKLEQRAEVIQRQTMGMLINPFVKKTYFGTEEDAISPDNPEVSFITFTFKVECNNDIYEFEKMELETIVADRNELVHHLLPQLDLNTIEGCMKADSELQMKNEILLPKIESLKSLALSLQEGMKIHSEFLQSEEGIKQIELLWLRQSRIISLLIDIASQAARYDGWTLLNLAGQILKQNAPEEIVAINERYGYKNLKQLILASELFDFIEEPTDNGGVRLLYRVKSEQMAWSN